MNKIALYNLCNKLDPNSDGDINYGQNDSVIDDDTLSNDKKTNIYRIIYKHTKESEKKDLTPKRSLYVRIKFI